MKKLPQVCHMYKNKFMYVLHATVFFKMLTIIGKRYYAQVCSKKFPGDLERSMRKLANIRNRLIHDRNYNKLENRGNFIRTFKNSHKQLQQIIREMNSKNNNKNDDDCVIL